MKIRILMMLAVLASIQGGIKNNGDAPNFILLNQDNIEVSLDQFKGKKVILEWTNHECPFVKRHYDTENMQSLQREMADQNIVWLSIISSAPNKQGFVTKRRRRNSPLKEMLPLRMCFLMKMELLEDHMMQKQHPTCI